MDESHLLTAINERTKIARENGQIFYEDNGQRIQLKDDTLVSMNFWGFHPSVFGFFHEDFIRFVEENKANPKAEFFIPITVNRLVEEKRVQLSVLPSADQWYGITYKEDKPEVERAFQTLTDAGKYPHGLWNK